MGFGFHIISSSISLENMVLYVQIGSGFGGCLFRAGFLLKYVMLNLDLQGAGLEREIGRGKCGAYPSDEIKCRKWLDFSLGRYIWPCLVHPAIATCLGAASCGRPHARVYVGASIVLRTTRARE